MQWSSKIIISTALQNDVRMDKLPLHYLNSIRVRAEVRFSKGKEHQ